MKTKHYSIRRKWFALAFGGFLFTSIFALSPSPAQAQCQRWDVSGQWSMHQRNGEQLQVNLQQGEWQGTSANLTGTGRISIKGRPDLAADIDGNITGNSVAMRVMVGKVIIRYLGIVGPDGKISGNCHNQNRPRDEFGWNSFKQMKCADANPQKAEASLTSDSESGETQDWHKKNKKNKKKHHHHDDDDQNQGND